MERDKIIKKNYFSMNSILQVGIAKTICGLFCFAMLMPAFGANRGPVCYFRFDEGDGFNEEERVRVTDFSGSGHDGKLELEGAYPEREKTEGKFGKGLAFAGKEQAAEGKGGYLVIPGMDKYDFSKGLTVAAWIKLPKKDAKPGLDIIMSNASGKEGAGFRFAVNDATLSFMLVDGKKDLLRGASSDPVKNPVTRDAWHHVAATYDGKTFKIYVDGMEAGSSVTACPGAKGQSRIFLGALTAGWGCNFNGILDEVKIYDYALTPDGIAADMKPMDAGAKLESIWKYDISGMDINDIAKRLGKNKFYKDAPILESAQQYNVLLMKTAFAEKRLRDIERASFHFGKDCPADLRKNFDLLEKSLNATWLDYNKIFRAFRDGGQFDAAPFTEACKATGTLVADFDAALARAEQDLHGEAAKKSAWKMPPNWGRQPRNIPPFQPSGKMNRLVVGTWGENPFPADDLNAKENEFEMMGNSRMGVLPSADKEGEFDYSHMFNLVSSNFTANGYATYCMLPYGSESFSYAPAWFIKKHAADPEIILHSSDGAMPTGYEIKNGLVQLAKPSREAKLNWYHPEVRALMQRNVAALASTAKNVPLRDMPFYEYAGEIHNVMNTPKGWRRIGYGSYAADAFRKYLGEKYGSIEKLNAAWQGNYRAFNEIQPPEDRWVKGGEKQKFKDITPIQADFEAFREDSLIDWMKDVYNTLKSKDPERPVAARHSTLLRWVNGARIFETCDILECHTFAPSMQVTTVYMASLLKLHKDKALAYLEDFWGGQQEKDRKNDEIVQRRGLDKHFCQTFAWGRTLQIKWYQYTFGAYIWEYNGNWMDPRQDFTLLRYAAPSLIVAKRKMEQADWMLTHTDMAKSRILLLQPSSSIRNGSCSRDAALVSIHAVLYPKNYLYELLPEEYLMNGKIELKDFDVVILPAASYLPPSVSGRLGQWVRAGGTLVAVEKAGVYTDLGIRDGSLMEGLLAMNWDAQNAPAKENEPPVIRNTGKGKVLCISAIGQLQQKEIQAVLFKTLDAATQRQAWSENGNFEILMRRARDGGIYLFVLNPNPDATLIDTVFVPQQLKEAIDMNFTGGCPIALEQNKPGKNKESKFRLRLGPCESIFVYCPPDLWWSKLIGFWQ